MVGEEGPASPMQFSSLSRTYRTGSRVYYSMLRSAVLRWCLLVLLGCVPCAMAIGQVRKEQPTGGCPAQPSTLRAMRNCYRPLLVFAPTLDDPKVIEQFKQLILSPPDLKSRNVLYVPVVPEGHNQPIPGSRVPTARLSEDELAATRLRFKVEPSEFLVILLGKDGGEKLNSPTPVPMEKIRQLIDSMPMRKQEMQHTPTGDE